MGEDKGEVECSACNGCVIFSVSSFSTGETVNLSQYQDMNIITGVIKLYLRELPIPLITFDAYKEIMKATGRQEKACQ